MPVTAIDFQVFADGFGIRRLAHSEGGALLERLVFDRDLAGTPGFVVALGERVARLVGFRHASYARALGIDAPEPGALVLVSEFTYGWRLAQVLAEVERERLTLPVAVALALVRQLVPAVALLGRQARDVVHGALGPERLVVTPQGRLVITEPVLASAVETLQYGRERLWRELRIATPPGSGLARMGPRTDAVQIGMVALALLLGRPIGEGEFPEGLEALVELAVEHGPDGTRAPIGEALRGWLRRALQLDARGSFRSVGDLQGALERVLAGEPRYLAGPSSIDSILARLAPFLPPVSSPPEEPAAAPPDPVGAGSDREPAAARRHVESAPSAREGAPPAMPPPAVPLEPAPSEPASEAFARGSTATAAPDPLPTRPAAEPAPMSPAPESPPASVRASGRAMAVALALLTLVALVEGALLIVLWSRTPAAPLAAEGELVVHSRPAAARVVIDGQERGVTPLTLRLPPGPYVLQLSVGAAEPRVIPLTILAGVQTSQYIELLNVPTTGAIEVRSDPPGLRVFVDGRDRGVTPLTIRDLPPGEHEVTLERGTRRVRQIVRVEPGTTAQLVVPLP